MSTRNFTPLGWFSLESAQNPQWKMGQNQKVRKKEKEGGGGGGRRELRVAIGSTFRLCIVRTSLDHSPVKWEMEKREIAPFFVLGENLPETYWPCYPLSFISCCWNIPGFSGSFLDLHPHWQRDHKYSVICYDEWQVCSLAVAAAGFEDSGCLSEVSATSPRLPTWAFYLMDVIAPLGSLLQKVSELPR